MHMLHGFMSFYVCAGDRQRSDAEVSEHHSCSIPFPSAPLRPVRKPRTSESTFLGDSLWTEASPP